MKRLLFIFGTRPEAIKMAPVIKQFQAYPAEFLVSVCVTAQHREMLDQVLTFFEIVPDYDLDLMKERQTLNGITARVLLELPPVFEKVKPHFTFVHGDTTTTLAASLAAFYYKDTTLCHIEAGLRTFNKHSPFPEEINRNLTSVLTDIHFSPTKISTENLLKEGISNDKVITTGNTVIDALLFTKNEIKAKGATNFKQIKEVAKIIPEKSNIILITAHRRENFGDGIKSICQAIQVLSSEYPDYTFIVPVHLNPNIKDVVHSLLSGINNVILIDPQDYISFIYLMDRAKIILTDSGGVQEEAPSLGKPVVLLRDTTERPEALNSGTVIKAGPDQNKIIEITRKLIDDKEFYVSISQKSNPYGDGFASEKIVNHIRGINS